MSTPERMSNNQMNSSHPHEGASVGSDDVVLPRRDSNFDETPHQQTSEVLAGDITLTETKVDDKEQTTNMNVSLKIDEPKPRTENGIADETTTTTTLEISETASDDTEQLEQVNPAKLFLGGLEYTTTSETITDHFNEVGTVVDVVVMTDKFTGKSRGFGFVTLSDPELAQKLVNTRRVIEGKQVDVRRAIPRSISRTSASSTSETGYIPCEVQEDEEEVGHRRPNSASNPRRTQMIAKSKQLQNSHDSASDPGASRNAPNLATSTVENTTNGSQAANAASHDNQTVYLNNRKVFVGGLHSQVTDDVLRKHFEKFGPVQEAVVLMDRDTKRSRGFGFLTFEHPSTLARVLEVSQHTILNKVVDVKRAESREQMAHKSATLQRQSGRARRRDGSASGRRGNHVQHQSFMSGGMESQQQRMNYEQSLMGIPIQAGSYMSTGPDAAVHYAQQYANTVPQSPLASPSGLPSPINPVLPHSFAAFPNYATQQQYPMYGVYTGWGGAVQPMYYANVNSMGMPGVANPGWMPQMRQQFPNSQFGTQQQYYSQQQVATSMAQNSQNDASSEQSAHVITAQHPDSQNTILQSLSPTADSSPASNGEGESTAEAATSQKQHHNMMATAVSPGIVETLNLKHGAAAHQA